MLYLETHSNDPEYNLAFEEYAFKYLPLETDEYVFLWQNGPSVIIGQNQNAWAEINQDYLKEENVKLVRRITGGGAVYHDLGNLNFSFVTKDRGTGKIDFKEYYIPIVNALRSLGVPAELSGRNDVTAEGKKLCGASQSIYKGRVLSNGCILFDVDLSALSKALKVRPEKLKSKGIASVRARVSNIKPFIPETSMETFKERLLEEIFLQKGEKPKEYVLSKEELAGVKKIYDERFGRWEWNYGKSPKGEYRKVQKFPFGLLEVYMNVSKGKIADIQILGDFFGTENVADIEKALSGEAYKREHVEEILGKFSLEDYFGKGCTANDILAMMEL